MKYFLYIPLILFASLSYSNEIEVIDLHENKSLDQMVLDQTNTDKVIETINTDNNSSDVTNISDKDEISSNKDENVDVTDIEINKSFFNQFEPEQVSLILENAKKIKSKSLQNEINNTLFNLNLDYNIENDREIFFLVVNYFYNIGDISKSYSLIKSIDLDNDKNENFYNILEINYLLSISQLENACNFIKQIDSEIKFQNNFDDKMEIFCLILQDQKSEAKLLNSILLETEKKVDKNFQQLCSILLNEQNIEMSEQKLYFEKYNTDLIFLYSAMARIAEVPLNEEFLKIDPLNLAIPIILNKSTPIELRMKAAHKSFLNGLITIESLAALYQSVDFNSNELNKPKETITKLSNSIELLMAYHFQLINIQIFPSERIDAVMNFWNFARQNNLENIAYSISKTIIDSIEIKPEYLEYSPQIAMSYINNDNINKAIEWISFYENANGLDDRSTLINMLIDFNSSNEVSTILDTININYENLIKFSNKNNDELFFVLFSILNENSDQKVQEDFTNIFDNRLTASLFITENIQNAIKNSDQNKLLIYSIVSINNLKWNEIHPSHLKLLLNGFLDYKNGDLIKDIILEIFEDYQLI
ncbi:hypothetical protein OAJ12_00640 [Pelagibacteraceae bacterium]|nr:hypothetical protein [Pelagibacteraceae bacterium]